jgi:hypothetical protein
MISGNQVRPSVVTSSRTSTSRSGRGDGGLGSRSEGPDDACTRGVGVVAHGGALRRIQLLLTEPVARQDDRLVGGRSVIVAEGVGRERCAAAHQRVVGNALHSSSAFHAR